MRSGQIARSQPLCSAFGYGRGLPIDRLYIERFLETHRSDIRGHVLEIGDDSYSRRFGGTRISTQDVLDVRPGHAGATITGSLTDPGVLPSSTFDCIIMTQTLHLIYELEPAVAQLRRALRPHGVLLITVPGVSSIDRGEWQDSWYWSFTAGSLRRLLSGPFSPGQVDSVVYGNLVAATAFLHGAAVEDVNILALEPVDLHYPVVIAGRAIA